MFPGLVFDSRLRVVNFNTHFDGLIPYGLDRNHMRTALDSICNIFPGVTLRCLRIFVPIPQIELVVIREHFEFGKLEDHRDSNIFRSGCG